MSDPTHQVTPSPDRQAGAAAPLGPAESARLTDFARACKAAARAVVLYPSGHPRSPPRWAASLTSRRPRRCPIS
jgi:hypothetical protein